MRFGTALAALLVAGTGCATVSTGAGGAGPASLPPLRDEGEVHVLALPLPRDTERLSFTVESVSLVKRDGQEVPLRLEQGEISGELRRGQRALASGRLPPGEYAGLSVKVAAASISREGQPARLLVEAEPSRVELGFRLLPGASVVVWVELRPSSVRSDFSFSPRFSATVPPPTPPQAALYCTNGAAASVTSADRAAKLVTGTIPVTGTPRGLVVDALARRAWVALHREDQIEMIDLGSGTTLGRIPLLPGDGPTDLVRAADGTLVVLNERSRTVAFVNPDAMAQEGRVPVGEAPTGLLLDRSGRRAFVANRLSASVTVIDVGNRAVFGTIATDAEPLRAGLSRDGTRLFVVHRGSNFLAAYAIPSLAPLNRQFIGLGATTLRVDPRTDLIYVSRGDERRIAVHDAISLQQIDVFDAPGGVSYMTIDDAENTLVALVPERKAVAVLELTSRRLVAEIPVGAEPYTVVFAGERP